MVINPLSFRVDLLVVCEAVFELVTSFIKVCIHATILEGTLASALVKVATWHLPENGLVLVY